MLGWMLVAGVAFATDPCPPTAGMVGEDWEGAPSGEDVPLDSQIVLFHGAVGCSYAVDFEVVGLDSGFEQERAASVDPHGDHMRVDVGLLPADSEMRARVLDGSGQALAEWTFTTGTTESTRPTSSPLLDEVTALLVRSPSGAVTGRFQARHTSRSSDPHAAVELHRDGVLLTARPADTEDLEGAMVFPADVPPLQTLCIEGRYVAADGQPGPPFEACGPVELIDEGGTGCATSLGGLGVWWLVLGALGLRRRRR